MGVPAASAGPRPRPRRPRARAGSPPPFDAALEAHGPALLRFCVARLGHDRGEECFQEASIAALRRWEDLRDPGAARSWLFQIAHRKILDLARARSREPVPTEDVEAVAGADASPGPAQVAADGSGDLWALVDRLPPKQREAVALRHLGELSHREVGAVMGTSEEAARRNVLEGLRRLRAELGPDRPGRA